MQIEQKQRLVLAILGDTKVGKTSLMNQYVNARFTPQYRPTFGADFTTKEVMINDTMVVLQIWDISGQEKFQSLGGSFYRGADCCVLVYDITNPKSFDSLNSWRDGFFEQTSKNPKNFPFLVVGNKLDLENDRKIQASTVEAWCQSLGNMQFFEVSAQESTNIELAFQAIIKVAAEKRKEKLAEQELIEQQKILNPTD